MRVWGDFVASRCVLVLALAVTACEGSQVGEGGGPSPGFSDLRGQDTVQDDGAGPGADIRAGELPGGDLGEVVPGDLTGIDTPPLGDVGPCEVPPFGFECPCNGNDECASGYCIEGLDGPQCTQECLQDCPEGWQCKGVQSFGQDVVFLCVPRSDKLCDECGSDAECGSDLCVAMTDGSHCTYICQDSGHCPAGFMCDIAEHDGAAVSVCKPISGACDCLPADADSTRLCESSNGIGTCYGTEICDLVLGWVDCDAPVPAEEVCDGVDNDCDGVVDDGLPETKPCVATVEGVGVCEGDAVCMGPQGWICAAPTPKVELCDFQDNDCDGAVDEDFKTGDKYTSMEHCGTCNQACEGLFDNGFATCDAAKAMPLCVVEECYEGFYQLNEFQCLPEGQTLCKPCVNDLPCEGGACLMDGGGAGFCTVPCGPDAPCEDYFVCGAVDGDSFCLPASGTCDCGASNDGATRPCSVTNEVGTCFGSETCDAMAGWVGCTALAAALEDCDGLDNDCNGVPDDGLAGGEPCTVSNGFGSCTGAQYCQGLAGWGCTAPEPGPEVCDYIDNDCDGAVDEGFVDGGKYSNLHHCGQCNKDCEGALPNAVAHCDASAANPLCKVEECLPGFFPLNDFQCIDPPDVQCVACDGDEDCYFGSCVEMPLGSFCLTPCPDEGCAAGHSCQEVEGFGALCFPDTGSCECNDETAGATISCSQQNEHGICFGIQVCDPAKGWSNCDAAVPVAELCNGLDDDCDGPIDEDLPVAEPCANENEHGACEGISVCAGQGGWSCQAPIPAAEVCDYDDNDCDGAVDEDFKDGTKYVDDAHCGTCNNACADALENATGVCEASYSIPKCVVDQCAEGYVQVSPFQCVVPPDTTCQPCASDGDCLGGHCVVLDEASVCAIPCDTGDDCAAENSCLPYPDLGTLCQPPSGSCECNSFTAGVKRSCFKGNQVGTCFGFETCDPVTGWSACDAALPADEICNGVDDDCNNLIDDGLPQTLDCQVTNEHGTCDGQAVCLGTVGWACQAPEPAPEICDYEDNDCDGTPDEDFTADGVYVALHHCGQCNKDCEGALPNAVAFCDPNDGAPKCKVDTCLPGFFPLNEFQCIAPPDVQCSDCVSDGDCYFDLCVPMEDGGHCLSPCEPDGAPCGEEYECAAVEGVGDVCVPVTGSCACNAANAGATVSCSEETEHGTCFGIRVCDAAAGWSDCNAAIPGPEVCNGLDDDCDGAIDEGLPPTQPCEHANEWGVCAGVETCDGLEGWVCQAPVPVAEICDYVDNDCDALIDEDFKENGKYVYDGHCGTCNNACVDAIDHATGACDAMYTVPKCVVAACDEGYVQVSPFQCVIPPDTTCQACATDSDCLGGDCVVFDGKTRCAIQCQSDLDCFADMLCAPYDGLGDICQPISGSCECNSFTAGTKRTCSSTNDVGICFGFETCDPDAGWSPCDAAVPAEESCDGKDNDCDGLIDGGLPPTQPCAVENGWGSCAGLAVCLGTPGWVCQASAPAQEICDYKDNNCDGVVDEGFMVDGTYHTLHHCGQCNNDCEGSLPLAVAFCDAQGLAPECKVQECLPGFFQVNDYQCIDPPDVQCAECVTDATCYFGTCVALELGHHCLLPCPDEGTCDAGFHCEALDGEGELCVPDTGSCECNEGSSGETISCSVQNPWGTCFGQRVCDPETGWSDCNAATPAEEVCDGVDNDCDGLLDDGLPLTEPCSKENEHGTCTGEAICLGGSGWVCQALVPSLEVCDFVDNDCDGQVDEGFMSGGKYVDDQHCGTCNNDCTDAIDNAFGVCDWTYATPKCVVDECWEGYFQVSPFQCVLPPDTTCQPCGTDQDCYGWPCVEIDGVSRCAMECSDGGDCADEHGCLPYEEQGTLCQPTSGSCECNSYTAGTKRTCAKENEHGTCLGFETCDPESGWSPCDALVPAEDLCDGVDNNCDGALDEDIPEIQPCEVSNEHGTCTGTADCLGTAGWDCQAPTPDAEVCNGEDDDCDGGVDEDFRNDAGQYADYDHCGQCFLSCAGGYPHATTYCDDSGGTPECKVQSCDPGYFKLDDTQCVPETSALCQECESDADCLVDGGLCVELVDGSFCFKPCADSSDCPAGYQCQSVDGGSQCIPDTQACTCSGVELDLSRACSATWPVSPGPGDPFITCLGTQFCTATGWGSCVLQEEACDGQDQDCNGLVDEGFLVGGKYVLDTDCGECGNDCTAQVIPNAMGICDLAPMVPACQVVCEDGYFDVNGTLPDGCECLYQGEEDLPDVDCVDPPECTQHAKDQNCDGVDGEVGNAVFVSPLGADDNPGTREEPLLTIQVGIDVAAAEGKRDVYVAEGTYPESISLLPGVGVYGGYSLSFSARDVLAYNTVIQGQGFSPQLPAAVTALGITGAPQSTVLDGFIIQGRNGSVAARSSYAIYVKDCTDALSIVRNQIIAGDGSEGGSGGTGNPGDSGDDGGPGTIGTSYGAPVCNLTTPLTFGGAGGVHACGGADVSGGAGGDSYCPHYEGVPDPGEWGTAGVGTAPGLGGEAGVDGKVHHASCKMCTFPNDELVEGQDGYHGGHGGNGLPGLGCNDPMGAVSGAFWDGATGLGGGVGTTGSGGGGGGAGGGADSDTSKCYDVLGGTGGGGGSGGCPGTGGLGGGSGGGTFGLFVVFSDTPASLPVVQDNLTIGGLGGTGGQGGTGGPGGLGGTGGFGGTAGGGEIYCTYGGGAGGAGGNGGHGGGGGGGCGGVSYCLYVHGYLGAELAAYKAPNNTCLLGAPGAGGLGGVSLGVVGHSGQAGFYGEANF